MIDPNLKPFIIGAPAKGVALRPYPPGSRVIGCELCFAPTLFAPSSLTRPEAATALFVCMGCAFKQASEGGEPLEIAPITDEQKRELAACGLDLADVEAAIDQLRGAARCPQCRQESPHHKIDCGLRGRG
jgi:hypothetical protein